MKSIRLKTASAALAALLTAASVMACGSAADAPAVPAETTAGEQVAEETLSEEEKMYADLPEGDFEGASFSLLQYVEIAPSSGAICVEELNGEAVNDAKYERDQAIQEKLNVEIKFTSETLDNVNKITKAMVAAGDDLYQAISQNTPTASSKFLMQGYLVDQNTIPGLDFSRPWWNKNAMDSTRLNERTYLSFGDINYYLFDFHSILIFSKPIVEDYGMSDPYAFVNDGKWTIDAFLEMCRGAAHDMNGDGVLGKKADMIGYAGYESQSDMAFTHAADAELFSFDPDGVISYNGVSEKFFDVISKYSPVLGSKEYALHDASWRERFRDGLTLFCGLGVGELSMMRDLEFEYGLVPFPKYDENQAEYIGYVTDQMQPINVPITAADTDLCGAVLENMAAESYRRVRENYFNGLVESKYVRDEESVNTLRMLFAGDIRFAIERVYDWPDISKKIWESLRGKADKCMSEMEKIQPKFEAAMEASLEAVSE